MAQERVQKQKQSTRQETHTEESNPGVTKNEVSEAAGEKVAEIDELLEERIDDELLADLDAILEENADEFVNNFVQEGGQ